MGLFKSILDCTYRLLSQLFYLIIYQNSLEKMMKKCLEEI